MQAQAAEFSSYLKRKLQLLPLHFAPSARRQKRELSLTYF